MFLWVRKKGQNFHKPRNTHNISYTQENIWHIRASLFLCALRGGQGDGSEVSWTKLNCRTWFSKWFGFSFVCSLTHLKAIACVWKVLSVYWCPSCWAPSQFYWSNKRSAWQLKNPHPRPALQGPERKGSSKESIYSFLPSLLQGGKQRRKEGRKKGRKEGRKIKAQKEFNQT